MEKRWKVEVKNRFKSFESSLQFGIDM